MNRTDRLMAIAVFLQGRRLTKAEDIARHFEISLRTVYRDIAALGEAGIPISGEAGVGYSLVRGYHLPPLSFDTEEAAALFIGAELARNLTDDSLRPHADSALSKIRSVLPRTSQEELDQLARHLHCEPGPRRRERSRFRHLLNLNRAIAGHRVTNLDYQTGGTRERNKRQVEPLGLIFDGFNWHLIAWCRLRKAMRQFRLDRIENLIVSDETFADRPDFSLESHLEQARASLQQTEVVLRGGPELLEKLRQVSATPVQALCDGQSGLLIRVRTFSLDWMAGWVLSLDLAAEVLHPKELRERIHRLAVDCAHRHAPEAKKLPEGRWS